MVDSEELCQTVFLYIAGRQLHNLGTFDKSDPLCIVSTREKKTKDWVECARTKEVKDDMNPDFPAIEMKYWFEKRQYLKFEIWDSDKSKPTKSMGHFETTMGKIMAAK